MIGLLRGDEPEGGYRIDTVSVPKKAAADL
jgi:hypothetical protein